MPSPPFPDTPRGEPPQAFRYHDFGGLNRNVPRQSIDDNQFFWLENLMPIAPGALRTMYAEAANIFTSGGVIINIYCYVLQVVAVGPVPFAIIFFRDGTASQVNLSSGGVVTVSAVANTFFNNANGQLFPPVAVQFNASGIVITSMVTNNAYWSWDGATLIASGSPAPNWLTNGVATTMPSGVFGSTIEVYQNRVWIGVPPSAPPFPSVLQAEINTSAPGNGADFLTVDGAVVTPQQDADLKNSYIQLHSANGYLYLFGDSSVNVISNVQTGGAPIVTTFTNQNLDPQVGAGWTNAVQPFGQAIVFANQQGVYLINGGVPTKVSYELDEIFRNADFTVKPSAAVATIFGIKCYILLIKSNDQTGTPRVYMLVWDTKEWWVASTINANLTQIYIQEFNGMMSAYGSDGSALFKLFQTPNPSLPKRIIGKLWSGGNADDGYVIFKKTYRLYAQGHVNSGAGFTFAGTIDTESTTSAFSLAFTAGTDITGTDLACYGRFLGVSATLTGASDVSVVDVTLQYASDQTFLG